MWQEPMPVPRASVADCAVLQRPGFLCWVALAQSNAPVICKRPPIWSDSRAAGAQRLHSISASRFTAGASAFFNLIQCSERPETYREPFRFETIPSLRTTDTPLLQRRNKMLPLSLWPNYGRRRTFG